MKEKFWENLKTAVDASAVHKMNEAKVKESTLCIIDINNGFAREGALYSPRVEKNITATAELAKKFLEASATVLAYTDYHPEDAKEFRAYPPHCIAETKESELVSELEELKSLGLKEIRKNSTNGILVHNPASDKVERDYVVVGCVTDICVYQFAMTLRAYLNEHDIEGEVYVVKDLVDTFDIDEVHDADFYNYVFLKSMMDNGIKVISRLEVE